MNYPNVDEGDLARASFSLPKTTKNRLDSMLPWGVRSHFVGKVLDAALDVVEKGGYTAIGAIMSGDFTLFQKPKETEDVKTD